MNCRGTAPPTTLSTNSNPYPSGSGSTSMSQTAYWPCPPDCFTCRPCPLALPPNVSRSGTRNSTVSTVTPYRLAKRVEHDVGVRLAHAPQHDLVGLGVLLDPQRRVLGRQPLQPDTQLVLVGLRVRLDGDRQQRLGHRPRLEQQRIGLVGQRVAGLGAGQPADRAQVARDHGCRRPLLLAERERQRADPLVLVVIRAWRASFTEEGREMARHVNRRVGPDGAGEHPDQADPADVRIRRRLHHLGEQRSVRVAASALRGPRRVG